MPQLPVQQQDSQEEASCTSPPPGSENVSPTPLLPSSRLRGPQPPPVNPLKFIKLTPPVSLFKPPPAREMPPPLAQKKEEAEDWQNDLEGWKFNRKKKQEHLMERVSEIKKSEEEQTNSASRRNKTFSEMMKARKSSIVVYNEGDENDFSEFGLGTKSQSEENSSDEVFQSSENEFTYEKAIQNYVEYASSRGNKPSAANGSETSKSDVVQTQTTMSVTVREDIDTQCNTNSQHVEIIEETKITSKETAAISKSDHTFKEKSKLADKINIFENPESFNNFSRNRLENQDETNFYPAKKAAPPVPAKPTKPVIKEEPSSLLMQQEVSLEFTNKVQWNEVDSSSKQHEAEVSEPSLYVEETTELVYSASPPISDLTSMQPPIQSSMDRPSEEDYVMNHEAQLSPAANSVCSSSLKLTDTVAVAASLEHVPPRDIQRSPLGGEDSGVHTADSVSQSDEVEDDEELPNQSEDGINGFLGILSSQVPIIDHELSALLAPPSRLEPPKEKPPPPPPVGVEPDTETMRKSFLGLEVTSSIPAVPTSEALPLPADTSDSDCLGNQLKERLLKLEEEKNNVINMEKQLKAEKLPLPGPTVTANKDSADSPQERLALEYEALKMERQAISSRKQASFAKKLAVKSLESLDIPPAQEFISTKDDVKIHEMEQHPCPPSSTNESENYHHTNNEIYVLQALEKNSLPQYYHGGELPPDLQKNVGVAMENMYPKQNIITEKQTVELETKYQSSKHNQQNTPKQNAMRIPESTPIIDQYQKSYHPSSHIQQQSNNYQHKQQSPPQQQQPTYSPPKNQSSPQQYYIPPTPWYGEHNINNKNYNYEDPHVNYFEPQSSDPAPVKNISNRTSHSPSGNWSKQPNCILQAPPIRKKGPPPPAKPSRVAQQKIPLTRNYSADSILESLDGDPPVTMRNPKGTSVSSNGGRASLQYSLGGSMSQLPSNNNNSMPQLRQRPTSQGVNYQHWLVQEAEHRRITEQHQRQSAAATLNNSRQPKHLPDAIIMSLTQRVQNRQSLVSQPQQLPQQPPPTQQCITPPRNNTTEDKVLSVSGKKKCSHCNLELGRGAAMIIESLRLFYHIDCFKCCVCCIQLGDGLMGTDVRVRNGKLHCHSCYSSDDGVKFSCV